MKITYLGHSCFDIYDGKNHILTDPYLTGNPLAAASAATVPADYILVSHCHDDHLGDTLAIAKRTGATVCGVAELRPILTDAGIKCSLGNIGGWMPLPFGRVKLVQAIHGSGLPGALACGFIIQTGTQKTYFAGDTAYYGDMVLLKDEKIDIALLPIGDYYTMGPKDAAKAARAVGAKITIPMHYDTFPVIRQDPRVFKKLCEPLNKVLILKPGECTGF